MSSENEKAIEYYKVLHGSVQNSHTLAWTITSIFIPIMFGSLTLLVVNLNDLGDFQYFVGSVVLLCLAWFWMRIIEFLYNCNTVRLQLLKQVETYLSSGAGEASGLPFSYYNVLYEGTERNKIVPGWISYMHLIETFATVFISLVMASLVYKLVLSAAAGQRFAAFLLAVAAAGAIYLALKLVRRRRRWRK